MSEHFAKWSPHADRWFSWEVDSEDSNAPLNIRSWTPTDVQRRQNVTLSKNFLLALAMNLQTNVT